LNHFEVLKNIFFVETFDLSRSLLSMILDENVKAISLGVLQQIDLDLVQCEQFAASEPIQGLEV
jgi:hypothetical protein